jgi:hypothetical protein
MSKFLRRHSVAVLTIAALASFHISSDQNATRPVGAFRDNPAWTVVDGALTTQAEAGKTPLVSRSTLADSVTSFDFRAPAGARATLFVQGDTPLKS